MKNSWGTGWGEDEYFRIAQTKKGPYGLFGVVSHGVVPTIAYNVTAQVEAIEQDTPLKPWAIIFIVVVAVIFAYLCVAGVVMKKAVTASEEQEGSPAASVEEAGEQ